MTCLQQGHPASGKSFIKEELSIDERKFKLSQQLPLLKSRGPEWLKPKSIEGRSRDLIGAKIAASAVVNGVPQTHIELHDGVKTHIFGEVLLSGSSCGLCKPSTVIWRSRAAFVPPGYNRDLVLYANILSSAYAQHVSDHRSVINED